eukprot:6141143-Prymnesium_polylepis.1
MGQGGRRVRVMCARRGRGARISSVVRAVSRGGVRSALWSACGCADSHGVPVGTCATSGSVLISSDPRFNTELT